MPYALSGIKQHLVLRIKSFSVEKYQSIIILCCFEHKCLFISNI